MREISDVVGTVDGERNGQDVILDPAPSDSVPPRRLLISVVVPCFNEEATLVALYTALRDLSEALQEQGDYRTEFILVDDGSIDRTWPLIYDLAARDSRFCGVQLSRNFGLQAALACGYAHARGDAVVSLDADLQDPPEAVPEMVRAWREGADVVFPVRESRAGDSWFKRGTAWLFYWGINRLGGGHVRRNVGDFRLLSRRCVDILNRFPERGRFFRDLTGWIGFPSAEIRYRRQPRRAGSTKFTFQRMQQLAMEGMVSASGHPLRYSWIAGTFAMVASTCLLSAALWPASRDTCLVAAALLFGTGLVLIGQGIQGLYLGRLFDECRHRPIYLVSDCTNPNVDGGRKMHVGAGEKLGAR